jgi:hypothetical protein
MEVFTQEIVTDNPSIAAQMVQAAAREVSVSLASTMITKRFAQKGVTLSADNVRRLAEYSLSESAKAARKPPEARAVVSLAKAMSAANGPNGDNMQETLSMVGVDPCRTSRHGQPKPSHIARPRA